MDEVARVQRAGAVVVHRRRADFLRGVVETRFAGALAFVRKRLPQGKAGRGQTFRNISAETALFRRGMTLIVLSVHLGIRG